MISGSCFCDLVDSWRLEMGFDPESVKMESLGMETSKGIVKEGKDGETVDVGCWVGFRFMEKGCNCMRFRSKVDSSRCLTIASYVESIPASLKVTNEPVIPVVSSTSTTSAATTTASTATTHSNITATAAYSSNAESTPSTPQFSAELKIASHLRKLTFNDLKSGDSEF